MEKNRKIQPVTKTKHPRDDHSLYHPCIFATYGICMGAGKP